MGFSAPGIPCPRPRKPREINKANHDWQNTEAFIEDDGVFINGGGLGYKECFKLAAWLLKAADYIEWKEKHRED